MSEQIQLAIEELKKQKESYKTKLENILDTIHQACQRFDGRMRSELTTRDYQNHENEISELSFLISKTEVDILTPEEAKLDDLIAKNGSKMFSVDLHWIEDKKAQIRRLKAIEIEEMNIESSACFWG